MINAKTDMTSCGLYWLLLILFFFMWSKQKDLDTNIRNVSINTFTSQFELSQWAYLLSTTRLFCLCIYFLFPFIIFICFNWYILYIFKACRYSFVGLGLKGGMLLTVYVQHFVLYCICMKSVIQIKLDGLIFFSFMLIFIHFFIFSGNRVNNLL